MRIVAVTPETIVNSIYRSFIPMHALAQRGHTVHIEGAVIRNPETLFEFDAVQFMRYAGREEQRLARRLRQAGVAVLWDNDDNLTAAPKGNPNHEAHSGLSGQRVFGEMTAMMRASDLLTTPSPMLAELYERASGTEARVIENHLPPTFTRPQRMMPHSNVVIGWVAAMEHQREVERLGLVEMFEELLARHVHVGVVTIGLNLGLRSRRYTHYPITRYGELPNILAHFDVGIAPLADFAFNRGRSNVKVKEYAAMGVPWLASPIGPYAALGEEQGGRLVADDRWQDELTQLIQDEDERRRLALRARRWAQGETIEAHVDEWEAAFEDAIAHARAAAVG